MIRFTNERQVNQPLNVARYIDVTQASPGYAISPLIPHLTTSQQREKNHQPSPFPAPSSPQSIPRSNFPNQTFTMKKTTTLASLLSSALLTNAQLAYDLSTQSLQCAQPNGVYCVGDSMSQSYIAHCNAGIATISCCTSELSALPPLGLKPTALCFQSSTTTGDASCALNGTIYPPKGPTALPAPIIQTQPIPAVVNIADKPPKDCGCHNGTHPLGPAGPTSPIVPPISPPNGTFVSPIIPPSAPIAPPAASTPVSPIIPSASSLPIAPSPPASTPVSPILPTAPAPGGYVVPTILPTGTGIAIKPTSTTSFSYTIGKPTVTPTASSTDVSPVQNSAGRRAVPAAIIGVVGAVALLL